MEEEEYDPTEALNQFNFENQSLKNQNMDLSRALSSSNFQGQDEQTLIHYQLETDKILERVKNFLEGYQIKFDEDGNSYFTEPTKKVMTIGKRDPKTKLTYYIHETEVFDPDKKSSQLKQIVVKIINDKNVEMDILQSDSKKILEKLKNLKLEDTGYQYMEIVDEDKKPLNEYGVSEFMRIMSMYITKETFLSFYQEERINEILADLGDALNNFLYCNYEKMGMDTKFKESKYSLLVLNLLHVVESCYRRAIEGGEQENLRTRAIVTQNQGSGSEISPRRMPMKQKWNPLKPSTW